MAPYFLLAHEKLLNEVHRALREWRKIVLPLPCQNVVDVHLALQMKGELTPRDLDFVRPDLACTDRQS